MTGHVGGTPTHPAGTGLSGAAASSRTLETPVQPTCCRGWSGWSGARRRSGGSIGSRWSGGSGTMRTHCRGGGGRGGAGAGGSATPLAYSGIVFFFLLIHLLFSIVMTFIFLVLSQSIVWPQSGGRDRPVFYYFYTNHTTNSNL